MQRESGGQSEDALLTASHLSKYFPIRGGVFSTIKGQIQAVDNVDFFVRKGETLGIVGESGCGKTTLARLILRLVEPSKGKVVFMGGELTKYKPQMLREARKNMQMVFQDPLSALDPRMTIKNIVGEPMVVYGTAHGEELTKKVTELLEIVGLKKEHLNRFPHEFSGGQRQRINVARALALKPTLIVLDEPTSALDVSVQAQILNLTMDLQHELGLAYLFIAHDLAVIGQVSDRIAVMYLGQIIELADRAELLVHPLHPYTEALISAVHVPDPHQKREGILLKGEVPSPIEPPPGCRFHTRCPRVKKICCQEAPILRQLEENHFVACHLYD